MGTQELFEPGHYEVGDPERWTRPPGEDQRPRSEEPLWYFDERRQPDFACEEFREHCSSQASSTERRARHTFACREDCVL